MPHHLVSEEGQKTFCIYCKRDVPISGWTSEWHSETHYKNVVCKCGKELHIKVNFEGSGHDSWNGKKFKSKIVKKKTIEDKVRILEGLKIVSSTHPKGK
jgi:hypothetical protein